MKIELIVIIVFLSGFFISCSARRPGNLGVTGGRLSPCPASPNCVSTQARDEAHRIEPILYRKGLTEARNGMLEVVRGMKRAVVISVADTYIHAEYTSAFLRFIDDVEFYFDDSAKIIHIRSASRTGYSDFNVNRKRVERIRELYRER